MTRKFTTPDRVMLLMSLVPYLKEHGPTPVTELASRFAVEPEIVRQLVRFLGVAGVPGETQTYQHEDLFDIDWEALEQFDLVSLTQIVAVDDTPRFSSVETAALIAGLHALAPMLPEEMRATARSTADKLSQVQPAPGARGAVSISEDPEQTRLTVITSAIANGRQLAFDYRDARDVSTHRRVEPLLLSQSGGAWYLRAFCLDREAERTFMIDRLREPRELEGAATHVPSPDAEKGSNVEGAQLTARVALSRAALQRIADFAPRTLGATDSGWVLAEVDLLHPAVAVRLVQAAPGEVVVEAPAAARDAVQRWAERALSGYDV